MDLHETITLEDGTELQLRDQLNPPDRPPSTAPVYPNDVPRTAPEPPRFATKFLEEFSGRQTNLRSFFVAGGSKKKLVEPSPSPTPEAPPPAPRGHSQSTALTVSQGNTTTTATPSQAGLMSNDTTSKSPTPDDPLAAPFSIARAAFDSISADDQTEVKQHSRVSSQIKPIDLTADTAEGSTSPKPSKALRIKQAKPVSGQTRISAFFAQPKPTKRKHPSSPQADLRRSASATSVVTSIAESANNAASDIVTGSDTNMTDEDALVAQAIAEADEEKANKRAKTNADAAPVWSNLFAKKLPPLCTVHQKPCKDFSELDPLTRGQRSTQSPRYQVRIKANGSGFVHCAFSLACRPVNSSHQAGRSWV
jgi:AP endonuclease-2